MLLQPIGAIGRPPQRGRAPPGARMTRRPAPPPSDHDPGNRQRSSPRGKKAPPSPTPARHLKEAQHKREVTRRSPPGRVAANGDY